MTTCPKCRQSYAEGVRFCPADGTLMASVVDPYLGRVLMGQFRLVAVAGRGAMGTVYRATQTNVARTVAVKVLRGDLLKDESALRRFLREAQAAARLSHPNIVSVHLVGETDEGVPFIVMEYVEGLTLGALCDKVDVVETRRALRIARQIASALSEAHAVGIVHRDLKAENILLAERARTRSSRDGDFVKVLDFGIAKLLGGEGGEIAQLTRDGTIFGTPHYIAPEQASGQEVDGRADLYALGVILFRMVTGRLPFDGNSGMQVLMRHVREAPPRPRDIRGDVPEALEALILIALQKQRERRYADADRFIEAIDAVSDGIGEEPGRTLHGLSAAGVAAARAAQASAPVAGQVPGQVPGHVPAQVMDPNRTVQLTPAPVTGAEPVRIAPTPAPIAREAARAAMRTIDEGGAAITAVTLRRADDPTATRAGETGLDAWAAQPAVIDEDYFEEQAAGRARHRGAWFAFGVVGVAGALVGAFFAWQRHLPGSGATPASTLASPLRPAAPFTSLPLGGSPGASPVGSSTSPLPVGNSASLSPAQPAPTATTAPAAAPVQPAASVSPAPRALPALVEEHVASAGRYLLRAGFESSPASGGTSVLRVLVEDDRGQAVRGASVQVETRHADERPASVAAQPDGDGYAAGVPFRAPGKHGVRALATVPGGHRLSVDFDVDVEGAAPPVAVAVAARSTPEKQRAPRPRRKPALAADSARGGQASFPVTVLPGTTTASEPIVPHALGPAPEALPAAPPPSRAAQSSRSPSAGHAGSRKAADVAPASSEESDPYQMLREAK